MSLYNTAPSPLTGKRSRYFKKTAGPSVRKVISVRFGLRTGSGFRSGPACHPQPR